MKKLLLLLVFCFVACFPQEKVFLRSLVMYYKNAEEMILESNPQKKDIIICFGSLYDMGNYKSTGSLKDSYDALCEKHNDMSFSRKFVVSDHIGPKWIECLGIDFVSINIVSDMDFDAKHPAGEPLGDIVRLESNSLKPYIDSGYRGSMYQPILGLVSDMTHEELVLLGKDNYYDPFLIGSLTFESQPTLSKTHNFTVTMTADDGRVFSDTIEITFE